MRTDRLEVSSICPRGQLRLWRAQRSNRVRPMSGPAKSATKSRSIGRRWIIAELFHDGRLVGFARGFTRPTGKF
jgi:hypothetical protein